MAGTLIDTLDTDWRRTVENIRAAAERVWSRPLHRYYTDHAVAHSERVIGLLDGLTAGMMATPRSLVPTEVFILLAAAYLHDIGMQDERFAGGDLEEIREIHHEVTAELIYRAAEDPAQAVDLGLPDDPGLVEAVALVAKGHRKVALDSAGYEPLVHGGEMLRLRLLAALLRFGDELDIDHRRVDLEQMKLLALPEESQLHWWKCHYVSGVSIVDEYIRVAYRFPQDRHDYEGFIVPLVEGEIRAKHAALEEIFRANAVKVALGPSQVRLMRLVQPLPPEVEALAKERAEIGDETPSRPAPAIPVRVSTSRPAAPPASTPPSPTTVFDMRGLIVDEQVNVARDYYDQRFTIITGGGNEVPPLNQVSEHPTSAELRRFLEDNFAGLVTALQDVWVSIGGGLSTKWSATSNWNVITSRFSDIPGEICDVFDEIVKTRELARGGPTRLSREQLSSAKRGISQVKRFLHQRFPDAGVELPSLSKGDGEPSSPASVDVESLRRQLAEARTNLRLIEERKAAFVMSTDVPLQLIKEEEHLRARIVELEAQVK